MIAVPWYFTGILGESSLFGVIYLVITIVTLFWGFYAGTLVDKYDRQKIFIVISVAGFLALALVSGAAHINGQMHWILAALAFTTTIFIYNLHYPNLYAFAQEITEPRHYSKITSYIEIQGQMTFAIAGALAAILLGGTEGGAINLFGFKLPVPFDLEAWSLKEVFLLDMATYLAATRYMPEEPSAELENFLIKNQKLNKSFVAREAKKGSLKATLSYQLMRSINNYHLLEVKPLTGRHHQIRVQLSAIGCPIKGDLKYGDKRSNEDASIHLHAARLEFVHPVKKEPVCIDAKLPDDVVWKALVG